MYPSDAKILIVDDSNFARTMIKNGLRELKFWKIMEATEAKQAQEILLDTEQEQDPVQLVICDIHMPNISGLELLQWMRLNDRFKDLPVIMLTNSQNRAEVVEAGKLGVAHYMIKPFELNTLREKIESTWQKHGQKTKAAAGR